MNACLGRRKGSRIEGAKVRGLGHDVDRSKQEAWKLGQKKNRVGMGVNIGVAKRKTSA